MLFLLGLQHDIESIMDDTSESENLGNPGPEQVDNFPTSDGEIDQPIYEGPQTWSHTRNLMKANILMDQMFETHKSFDTISYPHESIHDLILKFWFQQVFKIYVVLT